MDLLSLKRQYANLDLFEQSTLSNSAEDLSLLERTPPYPFEVFSQDQNDIDDGKLEDFHIHYNSFIIDDIPFEDGNGYDYPLAIQERLKKANEELEHDQTPSELKHRQRVSFDTIVKAVDIIQDPNEHENIEPIVRPCVSPVTEELSNIVTSPRSDNNTHEYTVPLNDTQPKDGLTLLQQIKELQFHGTIPVNERWATTANNINNDSLSKREGRFYVCLFIKILFFYYLDDLSLTSFKSNENNISNSTSSKNSMVVAVNDRFDIQDEDDYTAKHPIKSLNGENNTLTTKNKNLFLPTPPREPKQKQDSSHRPSPVRPKSSSDKKNKTETTGRQRPKR